MARHPIHSLLAHHAYAGSEPTTEELDELKLASTDRQAVRIAAAEARRMHADGFRGDAHTHAYERAREIVADLPPEQQDPNYIRPRDPLAGLNPDELAVRIPRI